MNYHRSLLFVLLLMVTLGLSGDLWAQRLEGPNPHKVAPKKRITDDMRLDAAAARKGVSPEARKAAKVRKAEKRKSGVQQQTR